MKIATVLGARPQFVKASVVSAALRRTECIEECVIHTGQHFDDNMSDVFFEELGMRSPEIHLGIHGGGHGDMTGRMLCALERTLVQLQPDAVLVYGDTNSTLAGSLAAAKLNIPVAHVEAGLRSFNRRMPEEVNRVMTDHISNWLFAPTEGAVRQLCSEGIQPDTIFNVGDVMYDVAVTHGERADQRGHSVLGRLALSGRAYALVTIHRQENTDEVARLRIIVSALEQIASTMFVVWPVHPRTKRSMAAAGIDPDSKNLILIEPQGYLDMLLLERHAAVIATDSGGVQKEAYFHRIPCVTLREETEWTELVEMGWNRLVPPVSAEFITEAVMSSIGTTGKAGTPFGDGRAAERIANTLLGRSI